MMLALRSNPKARTFRRIGEHQSAIALLSESFDLQRSLLGGLDERTLKAQFSLGEAHLMAENMTEAEALLPDCLEKCRTVLGSEHFLTANCAIRLATLWVHKACLEEAERLLLEVLRWRQSVAGDDAVFRLAQHQLGNVYMSGSQYPRAEQLLKDLLQRQVAAEGVYNFNTVSVRGSLGTALIYQGKLAEAEMLIRENLDAAREIFGSNNSNVLAMRTNLALLLGDLGRPDEALVEMESLLAYMETNFDPNHLPLLTLKMNRANLLRDLDRGAEAEAAQREMLPHFVEVYGDEHPKTGMVLYNLAEILIETDRFGEGESSLEHARALFELSLGKQHHYTLEAEDLRGVCRFLQGRFEAAVNIHEKVLAIKKNTLTEESPYFLSTLKNLASAYQANGQPAEARKALGRSYQLHQKIYGKDHPKTRAAEKGLAGKSAGSLLANE